MFIVIRFGAVHRYGESRRSETTPFLEEKEGRFQLFELLQQFQGSETKTPFWLIDGAVGTAVILKWFFFNSFSDRW